MCCFPGFWSNSITRAQKIRFKSHSHHTMAIENYSEPGLSFIASQTTEFEYVALLASAVDLHPAYWVAIPLQRPPHYCAPNAIVWRRAHVWITHNASWQPATTASRHRRIHAADTSNFIPPHRLHSTITICTLWGEVILVSKLYSFLSCNWMWQPKILRSACPLDNHKFPIELMVVELLSSGRPWFRILV